MKNSTRPAVVAVLASLGVVVGVSAGAIPVDATKAASFSAVPTTVPTARPTSPTASPTSPTPTVTRPAARWILVAFRDGVGQEEGNRIVAAAGVAVGLESVRILRYGDLFSKVGTGSLMTAAQQDALISALQSHPSVKYAEPDLVFNPIG